MSVLVVGSTGQVATHLREFLPDAVYLGRSALDLADTATTTAAVAALRPRAIINAAGYTAVDKAESERDLAWRINAEGSAALARAAAALEVPLLQVSTDYIFDGTKTADYDEHDSWRPLGVYGATKLAGEIAVRALCPRAWILRASWVFSEHGTNFVRTILRLAATRDSLSVVADQRGRPTYARDLAELIVAVLAGRDGEWPLPFGTYHATGGASVTWHEFAEAIVEGAVRRGMLAKRVPVQAIRTAEYPTAAARPANSALRPSPELRALGVTVDWQRGLDRVLDRLHRNA